MANLQTSFVPKHEGVTIPAVTHGSTGPSSSASSNLDRGFSLFSAVGFALFGLSLLLYGGAFAYHYLLMDQINRPCDPNADTGCGLRETLANDKRELQINQIIRYSRLDTKMKVAASIINSHRSVVPLLDALQQFTLQNIRFEKFDLSDKALTIDGVAVGYDDLAVQQKALGTEVAPGKTLFKDVVFSNIGLNDKGGVNFRMSVVPDPTLFSFTTFMNNQTANANFNLNQ